MKYIIPLLVIVLLLPISTIGQPEVENRIPITSTLAYFKTGGGEIWVRKSIITSAHAYNEKITVRYNEGGNSMSLDFPDNEINRSTIMAMSN